MRRALVLALLGAALAAGSAAASPPPPRPYEGPGVGRTSDGAVCVYRNEFTKDRLICTPSS